MDLVDSDTKESRKGLLGVEKITLVYIALTSILILALYPRMENPLGLLMDRVLIVALIFVLAGLYRWKPSKWLLIIRVFAQFCLLSYWYPDTFELNRYFPNLDHVFANVEQWCFNGQPSVYFCQTCPQQAVSEAFNMGYFFYYPMIAIVVLFYLFFYFDDFEKISFVIVTSFFLYYIVFILVPVAGPQYYFPAIGFDNVIDGVFPSIGDYFNTHSQMPIDEGTPKGFFYNLVEMSQQVGERPTAAFPSSHVGVATILMLLVGRRNRVLLLCLMPFYLLLCGATVYIQAHYLIDVVVGFVTAFLLYPFTLKLYHYGFDGKG